MFIVHTLEEIQGLIDAHGQFKATLGEADKEFQSIMKLINDVENFAKQFNVPGATINPYTNLTGAVSGTLFKNLAVF
jgi:actinin alpha